jgi:putative phage-type endonuclease
MTEQPTRDEWLAERRKGIGASDSPAILGESSWGSVYSVWAEKVGLIEGDDLSECEHIQAGNIFEEPILRWFNDKTGSNARMWPRHESVCHAEYPWMRCTPDAQIDGTINVQIKNVNAFKVAEWEHGPPIVYNIQVQHEMAVLNAQRTILVVCFGGNRLRWYEVDRNDRFIDAMILTLANFWKLVESKEPPPIDGSDATSDTIKRLHPDDDGTCVAVTHDATLLNWCRALAMSKEEKKRAEAVEMEAANHVRDAIGDATFGELPGGYVYSLKTQQRQKPLCPHCGERIGEPSKYRVLRSNAKIPDNAEYTQTPPKTERRDDDEGQ